MMSSVLFCSDMLFFVRCNVYALLTQWTWIWANSGREWRTGKPGVLQSMWTQTVRHDLATEQQQCICNLDIFKTDKIDKMFKNRQNRQGF